MTNKQETICIRVRLRENVSGRMYSADFRSYNGDITVDNDNFRYELGFDVPIDTLDELARENPDDAIQKIHLNVTNRESRQLDDRATALFMGIIPALAIEFYHRDSIIPLCYEHNRMEGRSEIEREYHLPRTAELENIFMGR